MQQDMASGKFIFAIVLLVIVGGIIGASIGTSIGASIVTSIGNQQNEMGTCLLRNWGDGIGTERLNDWTRAECGEWCWNYGPDGESSPRAEACWFEEYG